MIKRTFLASLMMVAFLVTACGTSEQTTGADNNETNETVTESLAEEAEDSTSENPRDSSSKAADETNQKDSTNTEKTAERNMSPNQTGLDELSVHYIDVGQADATLFQYKDDQESYTILYDTGDWRRNDTIQYLAKQNLTTIDLIVISHPDADHIGQLAEIVNTYDVGEVWMSGNTASSKTFQRAMQAVLDSGTDYYEPRTGDEFSIGPMDMTVLHPDTISGSANEESVSLLMSYGDVNFIFTGDADQAAEKQMIQSGIDLHADILQLGHHGSRTSSAPEFLKSVQPDVAIYSAGADSQYGHPHAEVVSLIQNSEIDLYGTDVHGTIIVKTDGLTYDILTNKDGTISPKTTGKAQSTSQEDNKQSSSEAPENAECIDINSASINTLQDIKHIGPARAKDLAELRPFSSTDDLARIKGIGPARITDIKNEGKACAK